MTPTVIPAIFTAKDRLSTPVQQMENRLRRFSDRFSQAGETAFRVGRQAFVAGAMLAAPLVIAAKTAVDFEEKMADVAKTTGMNGAVLRDFGDDILAMSTKTRTSINDLATIAEIGGRLGIPQEKLKSFTAEANKFAVALGGDFSGGVESAITQFGKVSTLFKDTNNLDISEALRKSGSAFNAISAQGVNVEGLTDFALRVGALPGALKPTLESTAALGGTFQKSGIDAQIAASGFSNFVKEAGANIPAFASQMEMTTAQAKELFNTDSAAFFVKFASTLKGVPADELTKKLQKLGLNSLEVQKAVGSMSGSIETYNKLAKTSAEQMKVGTSITDEYNVKNNTTAAQMAKLKNNVQALSISVGQALLPVINDLVEAVTPYIQSAAEWVKNNRALMGTIVKVVAGVAALAVGISGVSYAVGIAQKAMVLFGSASKVALGPIGLLISGIALAAATYDTLSTAFRTSATDEELAMSVRKRALENSVDQRVEAKMLFTTLQRVKEGTDEYREAEARLEEMQPGIIKNFKDKEGHLRNLAGLEKEYTKQLIARAMEEARVEIAKEKFKEAAVLREQGGGMSSAIAATFASFEGFKAFMSGDVKKAFALARVEDVKQATMLEGEGNRLIESANPQQSTNNNTTDIKDIKLVINGNDMGTFGSLQGKQTPVDFFGGLIPVTGKTK